MKLSLHIKCTLWLNRGYWQSPELMTLQVPLCGIILYQICWGNKVYTYLSIHSLKFQTVLNKLEQKLNKARDVYDETLIHYTFIHSFIHLFIYSYINSLIHSFIHQFIHSYIHSFISLSVYLWNRSCGNQHQTILFHLWLYPLGCAILIQEGRMKH